MRHRKRVDLPTNPGLDYEQQLWRQGFHVVAGLDEAGRGAWAGPVFAAAVVLPNDEHVCELLSGVRDSKKMSARQRKRWQGCIRSVSIAWAVASASEVEIDDMGILPTTCLAMRRALDQLVYKPHHLLVDYLTLDECSCPQLPLAHGDCLSLSIAAASVLAKTSRDAFMIALDGLYPNYGFARHMGYGTARHCEALHTLGACPAHRRSFRPIRELERLAPNTIPAG